MIVTKIKLLRVLGILAMWTCASFGAQMQVEEPPEPGGGGATRTIKTTAFSFEGMIGNIPPCYVGGSPVTQCQFLNDSGVDWDTLTLTINPGTEPVSCRPGFGFTSCIARQGTALLPTVVTFFGGVGIPEGEILHFKGLDWTTPTTFNAVANAVPEPASIAFMASGITAIGLLRRLRRRR